MGQTRNTRPFRCGGIQNSAYRPTLFLFKRPIQPTIAAFHNCRDYPVISTGLFAVPWRRRNRAGHTVISTERSERRNLFRQPNSVSPIVAPFRKRCTTLSNLIFCPLSLRVPYGRGNLIPLARA